MTNEPHHIRIADNLVEYMPAAGIGTGETDWVIIENNIVRNNLLDEYLCQLGYQ